MMGSRSRVPATCIAKHSSFEKQAITLRQGRESLVEGLVGITMMDPARAADGLRADWQKESALMRDSTSRGFSVSIGDLWGEGVGAECRIGVVHTDSSMNSSYVQTLS